MLTAPLKQTPEYKRLLAGMAGAKPAVVALFGMPPTARAQMLAALCEDTGRSALVVCAGEADATRRGIPRAGLCAAPRGRPEP